MSNVDHPKHYNQHPSGIECIQIARHYNFDIGNALKYLWRQGLKQEQGIDPIDKQIEDCKKAIWYIEDHIKQLMSRKEEPIFKCPSVFTQGNFDNCVKCSLLNDYDHNCSRMGFIKNPLFTTCNMFQKRNGSKQDEQKA